MKKKRESYALFFGCSRMIKVMKLTILLLLMGVVAVSAKSYSQATKVCIDVRNVTLAELFEEIEAQSDFYFFYKNDEVANIKRIDLKVKSETIEKILDDLLEGSDLKYKVVDRYIVISPGSKKLAGQRYADAGQKSVSGKVTGEDGQPLPGVTVVVKGTKQGTVTDADGYYSLPDIPENTRLQFSFVGMKAQEVEVGSQTTLNIVLIADAIGVDEVVVTALGIKREKKALGYAMQEIKTKGFTEIRSESVANMLQGKVAGVQINQSGTGMGGSTRIIMRGLNSLSGNNQPLWVIDGLPISDNSAGTANQWGNIDYSGSASEINPEDIESISVLKGANAAALYGSRAQNGAILVVTKKGKRNQGISFEYNGNVNVTTPYQAYKFQNEYGQGSNGEFSLDAKGSWGPRMTGQEIPNWRNEIYGDASYLPYAMRPQGNQMLDFYQTGFTYNNMLAVSGGSETLFGRLSYSDSRNEGITPTHSLTRQYFDGSMNFANKWVNIGGKISYIRQKGENRPDQGEYGIANQFIKMPRNIRIEDLRNPEGLNGTPVNWSGNSNEYINPFAYFYNGNGNEDMKNRVIGQMNASITFTEWLRLSAKIGIDWNNMNRKIMMPFSYNTGAGQYSNYTNTYQETNSDVILNFNKTFKDFSVLANFGAAFRNEQGQSLSAQAGRLTIPGLVALSNGNKKDPAEGFYEKEVHSVLGNAQFGYKSMLYLDFSARNDWSSTLPKDNWSYFYPSVSLSGVVSEMLDLPEVFSFMKLRGSWAKVGNDTSPYRLHSVYGVFTVMTPVLGSAAPNSFPLSTLKPESTQSYEVGTDIRMFDSRVGLDFTYYKSNTSDQILSVPVTESSGYRSKLINAGKMSSEGVELMLSFVPVQTEDWEWSLNFNWGTNSSKCIELDPTVKRWGIGGVRIGGVYVSEGGKFGDIVGKAYVRDEQGNVIINNNGLPVFESDQVVGNMMADWTGAVTSDLRWKNLSFKMLIDMRQGGDIVSVTDAYASALGNSERTLAYRDGGMIIKGVNIDTGAANNVTITAQQFYETVGGPEGVAEEFVYDGSFIKMREMSLGYKLPHTLISKTPFTSVKLSLVGRDLFFFKKNTPNNPEGAFSRSDYAQAFEISAMPPTRSFGFNLNVNF